MKTSAIALLIGAVTNLPSKPAGSLASWLKQHLRARSDLRRLQALDDRALADMGLTRSDVGMRVVREGLHH